MNRVLLVSALLLLAQPVTAQDEFLRGDVDGNGRVEPILDSFVLLDYAFSNGPVPGCFDAADVDNNGVVFAIIDALYLLQWGYIGGPDPDDPGTVTCGEDPEDGDAGCDDPPDPCTSETPDLDADPDYSLSIDDVVSAVGASATVTVSLTVDGDAISGLEFGVCHGSTVSIADEDDVTISDDLNDESATFQGLTADNDGFTLGVLLNVISGSSLDDVEDMPLVEATYSVDEEGTADIEFCDDVREPEVLTRVLVDGELVLPETTNGSITVIEGDPDYAFVLTSAIGGVDRAADISVLLTNDGDNIEGYQIGVCHSEEVDIEDEDNIAVGSDLDESELFFHSISLNDGNWTAAAVFDFDNDLYLEPGTDLELYVATYALLEIGVATVRFCTDDLDPALIAVVVAGEDVVATQDDGTIEIVDSLGTPFLRGDADSDGVVFGLLDSIHILRWGFVGGDAPPCLDAADVDDDGENLAILDALALLNWTFNDGDAPPDPGTDDCSDDPTDDDLDCLETSEECA